MKTFQYIFLAICALAETALLIFGFTGIYAYAGKADPNVPTGMVVAVTACAAVLLGITIRSFVKVAKNRERPILPLFLFKFPVMVFFLGIAWFALDIPEAGVVGLVLSLVLGALIYSMTKVPWGGKKQKAKAQAGIQMKTFTKEKAEWAWDAAAAEFLRLQGVSGDGSTGDPQSGAAGREFTDEENEKIYRYAGMPLAYFLGWLIKNDYVSEEFRSTFDAEDAQAVREKRMTPIDFLARCMDYVLVRSEIAPEVQRFVDFYYTYESDAGPFTHRSRRYFFDYYKVVCSEYDVPRFFCVEFDWDKFEQLSEILDRRLRDFRRYGVDEGEMEDAGERLASPFFDTEATLCAEPGTPPAYVQRCAAAYRDMSEGLRKEIAEALIEYCVDELPLQPEADWVIRHFSPYKVVVFKPESGTVYGVLGAQADGVLGAQADGAGEGTPADTACDGAVPAYVVLGESEWEPEHGISFTVIGDHAVAFGYYADAEPPYEEDLQWRYRILEDVAHGNTCAADVIPARFGGRSGSADNRVVVPRAAAERKEQYEDMIEALYVLKMAEHYDCKITYHEAKPNFLFVEATAGERRTFADSIALT